MKLEIFFLLLHFLIKLLRNKTNILIESYKSKLPLAQTTARFYTLYYTVNYSLFRIKNKYADLNLKCSKLHRNNKYLFVVPCHSSKYLHETLKDILLPNNIRHYKCKQTTIFKPAT